VSQTMDFVGSMVEQHEVLVPHLPPREHAFNTVLLMMLQSGDGTDNPREISNLVKMLLLTRVWAKENGIKDGEDHPALMSLINLLAFKHNALVEREGD